MRIDWDTYFINIAKSIATRATCNRKLCGCIIVKNKQIISAGYNGSVPNTPHCDDVGHLMHNNHCIRTIHAETNAILQAAKTGTNIKGGTIYITCSPCWDCFKYLITAGIEEIIFEEEYNIHQENEEIHKYLNFTKNNITYRKLEI